MSNGSAALQTALYAALAGASPAICGGRIHDDVPEGVAYPFVQIGDSQALPDDVTCSDGTDEFVTLHVWSRHPSKKAVKDIIGQIHDLFHAATLTVAGRTTAHSWVDQTRVLDDPDGITRHGIVTIRVLHHA